MAPLEAPAEGGVPTLARVKPGTSSFLFGAETDETLAWLAGQTISGELGDPVDVVPVMRFLAAPDARWVTAQTVFVNGGMISPIN